MVQHPVMASYTVGQLWINQGQNLLRASQARFSANNLADQVESLFEQDYTIEQEYHSLLNGMHLSSHALFANNLHLQENGISKQQRHLIITSLISLQYDGSDSYPVLLLATADG